MPASGCVEHRARFNRPFHDPSRLACGLLFTSYGGRREPGTRCAAGDRSVRRNPSEMESIMTSIDSSSSKSRGLPGPPPPTSGGEKTRGAPDPQPRAPREDSSGGKPDSFQSTGPMANHFALGKNQAGSTGGGGPQPPPPWPRGSTRSSKPLPTPIGSGDPNTCKAPRDPLSGIFGETPSSAAPAGFTMTDVLISGATRKPPTTDQGRV